MGRGDGVSISLTLDWPVKHIAPRSSCKKIFRALLNCEARFFYFSFAGRFYGPGKVGAGRVRRLLIPILLNGGFGYDQLRLRPLLAFEHWL